MAQPGYAPQWSAEGRDDLGIIKRIGANAIRLYHPIGEDKAPQDHGGLLDAALGQGLKVFGAVHQYLTCNEDDCYTSWNKAVADGFKQGFKKDGVWHPSVWAINMINEVDAMGVDPPAQVKRIISAVDGLLDAEQAAGISTPVNMTSCFTTAIAAPLGGGDATVYHGFSSMEAWLKDNTLVQYTPKKRSIADLASAINSRWIHCVNAQIPWNNGLKGMIADHYDSFLPRPWIIGEMGYNGAHQDVITSELQEMETYAEGGHGFAGSFFFQFQTAYFKIGPELNFGIFGLGENVIGKTGTVGGRTWDVHCLTTRIWAFEQSWSQCKAECDHRADAVAKAWGGSISGNGVCADAAPIAPPKVELVV